MAAFLAVVGAEGVAGEDAAPGGIFVEVLEGLAAAVAGALGVDGAFVAVVLARVIFAPDGGVDGFVADLDDTENVFGGLGLPGDDVLVKHQHEEGGGGGAGEDEDVDPEGKAATIGEARRVGRVHGGREIGEERSR